jgi:cobalt-zinc-cadmium resistance protein CzcA
MGGFVAEVRSDIQPLVADLPEGYFVDFGGQFENHERAMRRLALVVPVSVVLILVMLFVALNSLKNALLVIVILPFSLVGGIVAILALDIPLSVSASIGFIALFGIAVQNGMILVSFLDQERRAGSGPAEALRKACELRLRPILMTAITTLLGLLPLVWATGSGSEIHRPLAAVVLGGLVTATATTMVVLPALYAVVEGRRQRKTEASS